MAINYNFHLTKREFECLSWLSEGMTAKEIAIKMNISHRTVEQYVKSIKEKTNFYRRSQLVTFFKKEEESINSLHNINDVRL
ncbi:MAG: hypothetical protein BGO77_04965 [Caedibacter sp. 37-49]|nr:MAG: hypothetical protein BGO77_04965 [Caedibacter sp. 37-49]